MSNLESQEIYLSDYSVPDFLIEKTDLVFALEETHTTVTTTLRLSKNPESKNNNAPLVLHGQEVVLRAISIDGRELVSNEYSVTNETLTLQVPDQCVLVCETEIKPQENTSLEGLYKSNGMYCTQCEAEGFRKITYYQDRPDVMSEFSTRIIADKEKYPVLLSNGNLVDSGELDNGYHWVEWHDPFKKPAYLFALVAGDLESVDDTFVTCKGREVTLRIFVESKDLDKCDHAMQSLKHSMKWDEDVYGREYDLDIFMIVAVDYFNMGAMENKGLNIFNTSCVLAKPETTTDAGFQRVEAVVAHEYFHNWSGNRVTCRDWFQLSLKEGFTVFRDSEFSSDMGSRAVKRIEDVTLLRTLQFAEDAGPMSHPVQPQSFIEISNFYTVTIYEKGAEVVRMLHTLLGAEKFREGSDLYFERHDGQAVTINEFVNAMETVSGRDLSQFKHWYIQAGTPVLTISDTYNADEKTYQLTVKQHCPDTPEAKSVEKKPYHLPLAMGLVGNAGCFKLSMADDTANVSNNASTENTHRILEITQSEQTFTFTGISEKPVPSLLRGFSAPVRLVVERSRADYLQLLRHDNDAFSRWDAVQQLAVSIINDLVVAYQKQETMTVDPMLQTGLKDILLDQSLDKAMVSLLMTLPSEAYLAEISDIVDVDAIHHARRQLMLSLATGLRQELLACYTQLNTLESYEATADAIAKRSLKNIALSYLMLLDDKDIAEQCFIQFSQANNMTDNMAALKSIVHSQQPSSVQYKQEALSEFYEQWQHEALVVNQWLMVQASIPSTEALNTVNELLEHPCFSMKNPNKVRALVSVFAQNMVAFHQVSGEGYRFLADRVITLNTLNPQVAARIITPLTRWKKYDSKRQELMRTELERIKNIPNLSKDVFEVVSKSL